MRLRRLLVGLMAGCILAWGADVTGKWIFTVETSAGTGSPSFELVQKGEDVTGAYAGVLGQAKVTGTMKGDKLELRFRAEAGGETIDVEYKGVVDGSKVKGTVKLGTLAEGTFTGSKQ